MLFVFREIEKEKIVAVTFKDVARLAGVSTQTVSRVTNGADNVAEETRKKVNEAIRKLEYVPNKGAQMLGRAKSHILGIISLDIYLHGVALIANGIRNQAHELGYTTALSVLADSSIEGFRASIRELLAQKIESIIVNVPISKEVAESLVAQFSQLTFVFIDVSEAANVNNISCDHQMGALLGISHLIDCKCKHFICITGPKASTASALRYQTWQAQIAQHELIESACYEGNWQASSGYHAIKHALLKGLLFDAVLVANDQMALGVLGALAEAGIQVPKTVCVIGFDGINDSAFFSPPLTTIKQDFDELGRRAAALALNASQHLKQKTVKNKLPVELVIRQTSRIKSNEFSNKQEILSHLDSIRALVVKDMIKTD